MLCVPPPPERIYTPQAVDVLQFEVELDQKAPLTGVFRNRVGQIRNLSPARVATVGSILPGLKSFSSSLLMQSPRREVVTLQTR